MLARFEYIELPTELEIEPRGRLMQSARKHGVKVVLFNRALQRPRTLEGVLRPFLVGARSGADICRAGFRTDLACDVRLLMNAHLSLAASGIPHGFHARGRLADLVPLLGGDITGVVPGGSVDLELLSRLSPSTRLLAVLGEAPEPRFQLELLDRALQALGEDKAVVHIDPEEDDLGDTVRLLGEMGFRGLDAGRPFRGALASMLERPRGAGTSSTAVFREGGFVGRDTVGPAVLGALAQAGVRTSRRRALILGAGAAARSVALALRGRTAGLAVAGRSLRKALEAARAVGASAASFRDLPSLLERSTLLVRCLPEGAGPTIGASSLRPEMVIVDLSGGREGSPLSRAAAEAGALAVPGREVLLRRTGLVLGLFTGARPAADLIERLARGIESAETAGHRHD